MTYAQAVECYDLSPTTIQKWKRRARSKITRQTKLYKIMDDVLLNNVKDCPGDYQYERAHRLLFLSLYGPDLNPIEKKWAQVKFLRQGGMEKYLSKLFYDINSSHNTFILK